LADKKDFFSLLWMLGICRASVTDQKCRVPRTWTIVSRDQKFSCNSPCLQVTRRLKNELCKNTACFFTMLVIFGLTVMNFHRGRQENVCRETNLDRFLSHYGSNPAVYAQIWRKILVVEKSDGKGPKLNDFFESTWMRESMRRWHPVCSTKKGWVEYKEFPLPGTSRKVSSRIMHDSIFMRDRKGNTGSAIWQWRCPTQAMLKSNRSSLCLIYILAVCTFRDASGCHFKASRTI
jgi:hypothetical protein